MTPERWRQIEELFEIVSEMSPEEREAYLLDQFGDEMLRKQVES
jgi:hypothetical protein